MTNKLDEARKIIDEVDTQMAELFVKRMRAAELVYEYKKEFGLPILDQKRENAVIEKNALRIQDDVLKGYYIDYLKHLMSISRAYQYRMQEGLKVAYSGVEGAFAHIAAGRIFPESNRISYRDFKAAYDAVANGEKNCADLCEVFHTKIGDIPAEHGAADNGSLFIVLLPGIKIPVCKRGQSKLCFFQKTFSPDECGIDFAAIHFCTSIVS